VQLIVNDGTKDSDPDTVTITTGPIPVMIKITQAEWEARRDKLKVRGLGPIGEEVIITNANTGDHLGEAEVDGRGKWKLDVFDPTSVPCSVRATLDEDESAEVVREVKNAPGDCGDDDEEKDD
jgi:hypothetical protein